MSHSIDDAASPINRQFMNVIHEWLAVLDRPDKLFFYTYDMGMWGWWSLPYPALTDLFRDWTVFRRLGVGGDTIQAGSYHFAVYALNYLAVANVLRDAPRSLDAFLRAYCRDYFGEAAGVMERLIRSMEANFGRKAGVQIRPKPWLDIHRAFSPNHVAEWRRLVDRALALTENSLVRWRIERIRTLVNYIQLWLEAPRDIHLRTAAWAAKRGPCEFLRPYMKRRPTARETAVYERWLATLKQFAHESLLTGQGIFPHDFSKQRIY